MFQLPLLFPHKFKSLSDPSGASPFGQEGLATSYIPWGPPHWAGLSHCSSLLWLPSSLTSSWLLQGSHDPPLITKALFMACFRHTTCEHFIHRGDELNLAHHLRHFGKGLLKIPSRSPLSHDNIPLSLGQAGQVQCFKWGGMCAQGSAVLIQGQPLDLYEKPSNPIAVIPFL